MAAYLVLLLAILSRLLPFAFHTTSVGFTAVGGGLLFFGARRSRWQTIPAVLALMATDWYLTTQIYNYPFHASAYLVTWFWYAAVLLLCAPGPLRQGLDAARRRSSARQLHLVLRAQ